MRVRPSSKQVVDADLSNSLLCRFYWTVLLEIKKLRSILVCDCLARRAFLGNNFFFVAVAVAPAFSRAAVISVRFI